MRCLSSLRKLLLLAVLAGIALPGEAQQAISIQCESCGKLFATEARKMTDLARGRVLTVCRACSEHPVSCAACGLPAIGAAPLRLADGRAFCTADAAKIVRDPRDAARLWEQVKLECARVLHQWPPLPDTRITFKLVDRDAFAARFADQPTTHDYRRVLGLTHTRNAAAGQLLHTIYLLEGQLPAQFTATAAHEYAHAWLNERLSASGRKITSSTAEGVCELIAWKVTDAVGEKVETLRIEQGDYAQGQLQALLAAERRHRFLDVVEWIDRGQDTWLHPQKPDRLFALEAPAKVAAVSVPPVRRMPAPSQTPPQADLRLNGIMSTSKSGRVAVINGLAFTAGEKFSVKLGAEKVPVQCETIGAASVIVLVGESADRRELRLGSVR